MSDLDTLVVTFQAQLLDVMETMVKNAMHKVTQLVEDCFLDEVKRRSQELETLRIKLECAELKLNEGVKDDTFVEIASDDDGTASKEGLGERHGDLLISRRNKESEPRWTGSQICETETEADDPPAFLTPGEDTLKNEHADVMPTVNVKEEVNKDESDSPSESARKDANASDCQKNSKGDVFLKNVTEKKQQISNAYNFPEVLESSDTTTDLSAEMHTGWTGLTLHHHRVEPDWECDAGKSNCSINELVDSVTENERSRVTQSRDQLSASSMQNPNSPSVQCKQEVFVASGAGIDIRRMSKKASTKSGNAAFSCATAQNPKCHKTVKLEGMKLHSKDAAHDRAQAPVEHVSRGLKKPPPTPSNGTAALSRTDSHTLNLTEVSKIPCTSKAAPSTELSVQRDHLVNNRSHILSANSHHGFFLSHPDRHPVFRHSLRCGQCGKCFPHPSNLKAHLLTHTGERPFCCSLCGRSFTKLSNLKAHRRVHTGERPYCCLACGKRFTQKCNLKRHQRIHVEG